MHHHQSNHQSNYPIDDPNDTSSVHTNSYLVCPTCTLLVVKMLVKTLKHLNSEQAQST
jgi:hypothetical protein